MTAGPNRLTDREREALQLFAHGHDAKSAAATLGISVHAVNERLREARRKLGVSSSREAARISLESEAAGSQENRDEKIGIDRRGGVVAERSLHRSSRNPLLVPALAGVCAVLLTTVIALALSGASTPNSGGAPQVVATSPSEGSMTRPGAITLSVTFDRPMMANSMSFVRTSPDSFPQCDGRPVQSRDGRTWSMRCTVRPGRTYEVWFNRGTYRNFRALDGTPATPRRLTFRTSP